MGDLNTGSLQSGGLDGAGLKSGGLVTGALINTGLGKAYAQSTKRKIRSIPPPQIYPDGGGNSSSTMAVQTSPTKWQVSEGVLLGSYDITDVISLVNLATDLALNAGDDALYLEIVYDTSNYPTVTSATFKANGTYGLPAGGNCEYINTGTGGAVNNVNSITRAVIAKATVDSNGNNVIRQCLFGTMWIQQNFKMGNLSGGGTPKPVVFGLVQGGGPG